MHQRREPLSNPDDWGRRYTPPENWRHHSANHRLEP